MTFVKYILGNFWHFIGFTTILTVAIKGVVALAAVVFNRKVNLS